MRRAAMAPACWIIGFLVARRPGRCGPGADPCACRWKAGPPGLLGDTQAWHRLAAGTTSSEPRQGSLGAQKLLEALRQLEVCRVTRAARPGLGPGIGSARHAESALGRCHPRTRTLVSCGLLLLGTLSRVTALALLARLTLEGLLPAAHPRDGRHPGNAPAATATQRTHHLLGLAEPLEQTVHLGDAHPR